MAHNTVPMLRTILGDVLNYRQVNGTEIEQYFRLSIDAANELLRRNPS